MDKFYAWKSGRCKLECYICKSTFTDTTEFWKHIKDAHHLDNSKYMEKFGSLTQVTQVKLKCEICKETMLYEPTSMNIHMKSKHPEMTLYDYYKQFYEENDDDSDAGDDHDEVESNDHTREEDNDERAQDVNHRSEISNSKDNESEKTKETNEDRVSNRTQETESTEVDKESERNLNRESAELSDEEIDAHDAITSFELCDVGDIKPFMEGHWLQGSDENFTSNSCQNENDLAQSSRRSDEELVSTQAEKRNSLDQCEIQCHQCDFISNSLDTIAQHELSCHGEVLKERYHQCNACSDDFRNADDPLEGRSNDHNGGKSILTQSTSKKGSKGKNGTEKSSRSHIDEDQSKETAKRKKQSDDETITQNLYDEVKRGKRHRIEQSTRQIDSAKKKTTKHSKKGKGSGVSKKTLMQLEFGDENDILERGTFLKPNPDFGQQLPFPGSFKGREMNSGERLAYSEASKLSVSEKLDKILQVQHYLPHTYCMVDQLITMNKIVLENQRHILEEINALKESILKGNNAVEIADPSSLWHNTIIERCKDFPTNDINFLHEFFHSKNNWDIADAHMLWCLKQAPVQYTGRFVVLVLTAFVRRPMATKITWGFKSDRKSQVDLKLGIDFHSWFQRFTKRYIEGKPEYEWYDWTKFKSTLPKVYKTLDKKFSFTPPCDLIYPEEAPQDNLIYEGHQQL